MPFAMQSCHLDGVSLPRLFCSDLYVNLHSELTSALSSNSPLIFVRIPAVLFSHTVCMNGRVLIPSGSNSMVYGSMVVSFRALGCT